MHPRPALNLKNSQEVMYLDWMSKYSYYTVARLQLAAGYAPLDLEKAIECADQAIEHSMALNSVTASHNELFSSEELEYSELYNRHQLHLVISLGLRAHLEARVRDEYEQREDNFAALDSARKAVKFTEAAVQALSSITDSNYLKGLPGYDQKFISRLRIAAGLHEACADEIYQRAEYEAEYGNPDEAISLYGQCAHHNIKAEVNYRKAISQIALLGWSVDDELTLLARATENANVARSRADFVRAKDVQDAKLAEMTLALLHAEDNNARLAQVVQEQDEQIREQAALIQVREEQLHEQGGQLAGQEALIQAQEERIQADEELEEEQDERIAVLNAAYQKLYFDREEELASSPIENSADEEVDEELNDTVSTPYPSRSVSPTVSSLSSPSRVPATMFAAVRSPSPGSARGDLRLVSPPQAAVTVEDEELRLVSPTLSPRKMG
jgi:hypothetical protein